MTRHEALECKAWWDSLPSDHHLKTAETIDILDLPHDSPFAQHFARILNEAFERETTGHNYIPGHVQLFTRTRS